jgi:hypothetical protein
MKPEIMKKGVKGKASEIRIIDLSIDDETRITYLRAEGLIA